jgi:D-tyrosyl-tRNA(Tyr) deacylase
MFEKYLVIASREDPAGMNIVNQLTQFRPNPFLKSMNRDPKGTFDIQIVEGSILENENLDFNKINKYEFVIFASKHSSSSKEKQKTLSIHNPGNFREANLGGIKGKVCPASALFNKYLFEKLNEKTNEHSLRDYKVTLEVTHHGPLIDIPCAFIEIGPTEHEWRNSRAGFIIAKTINEAIEEFEYNPYREIAIGIGGPHYCPGFNKIQEKSNTAISHIIPQYVMPITEEMILEVMQKTEEEVDFAVLDWKGLGKSEQRQEIIDILEKNRIRWKKSSEIKR